MDLRCKLGHLYGGKVLVNGTAYSVGPDGIAKDIKPEDAKKLLFDLSGWAELPIRTPIKSETSPAPTPPIPLPPSTPEEPPLSSAVETRPPIENESPLRHRGRAGTRS